MKDHAQLVAYALGAPCKNCSGQPDELHDCPLASYWNPNDEALCNCCTACIDTCIEKLVDVYYWPD